MVRLDDQGIHDRPDNGLLPGNMKYKVKVHPGKGIADRTVWACVDQEDIFSALEKGTGDQVGMGGVKKPGIKILGQKRGTLLLPGCIIGARILRSLNPVGRDITEPGRFGAFRATMDQPGRIFDIRHVCRCRCRCRVLGFYTASHRVADLGPFGGVRVRAPKCFFIDYGFFNKRLGRCLDVIWGGLISKAYLIEDFPDAPRYLSEVITGGCSFDGHIRSE